MVIALANDLDTSWRIEDIPDQDALYLRVHRSWWKDGKLNLGCFSNHPKKTGGMSTDWSKYSTPDDSRDRAKSPPDNAVFSLNVGAVRAIQGQTVEHSLISGDPEIPDNRAHAEVFGPKNTESRVHFGRIYQVEVALDDR